MISFTEPDLLVTSVEGEHSNYIAGTKVHGGSSFKDHLVEPFSKWAKVNSAKAWGISEDVVQGLWNDKGDSTKAFGTAVHKLMENEINGLEVDGSLVKDAINISRKLWLKNMELGEKIHQVRKDSKENYARPTHKDIVALMKSSDEEITKYSSNIVSEFKTLMDSIGYSKYKQKAEVYVTYSPLQMGGEADLLIIIDEEKKICRVGDYKCKDKVLDKLSSNNKLLHELEKKKASENDIIRIQLSFYAYCLHKAGWTVLGCDVFGRNGEWKHYPLDLIPMEQMEILVHKYLG